jgi:hypothetical protein
MICGKGVMPPTRGASGCTEIHLQLAAAYRQEPWLEPMFNERLQLRDGRMWMPDRPGLGFSLFQPQRAGRGLDGGHGGVRQAALSRPRRAQRFDSPVFVGGRGRGKKRRTQASRRGSRSLAAAASLPP